ncbi:hypothetical protein HDU93_004340 [Gonapodya sp. JEL0774]|nr:hypothetical protein HDU93_004340 [Gonapodya sp. JEL0774]
MSASTSSNPFPQTPIAPLHLSRRSIVPTQYESRAPADPKPEPLRRIDVDFLSDVQHLRSQLKKDAQGFGEDRMVFGEGEARDVATAVDEWIDRIFELVKDNIEVNGVNYDQAVKDGQVYEPISRTLRTRLTSSHARLAELHLRLQEKRAAYPAMAAQLTADALKRESWCTAMGMAFPEGEGEGDVSLIEGAFDLKEVAEEFEEVDAMVSGELSETMVTAISRLAKANQIIQDKGLKEGSPAPRPALVTPNKAGVLQEHGMTPRTARKQILRALLVEMSFFRFLPGQAGKSDAGAQEEHHRKESSLPPVVTSVPSITVTIEEHSDEDEPEETSKDAHPHISVDRGLLTPPGTQRRSGSAWNLGTTRSPKRAKIASYVSASSFEELTASSAKMGGTNGFRLDPKKLNSLHRATFTGDANRVLGMLLKKKDVNKLDKNHACSATAIAAAIGHMGTLEVLLAKRPNMNLGDPAGRTPLILASIEGHVSIVKRLIKQGANLNITDHLKASALHYALLVNSISVATALLEACADFSVVDKVLVSGCTLLHHAVRLDLVDLASLLIAHGHPVDVLDPRSKTPLHYAVEMDSEPLVHLLLVNGAGSALSDSTGKTPIEYARRSVVLDALTQSLFKHESVAQPSSVDTSGFLPHIRRSSSSDKAQSDAQPRASMNIPNPLTISQSSTRGDRPTIVGSIASDPVGDSEFEDTLGQVQVVGSLSSLNTAKGGGVVSQQLCAQPDGGIISDDVAKASAHAEEALSPGKQSSGSTVLSVPIPPTITRSPVIHSRRPHTRSRSVDWAPPSGSNAAPTIHEVKIPASPESIKLSQLLIEELERLDAADITGPIVYTNNDNLRSTTCTLPRTIESCDPALEPREDISNSGNSSEELPTTMLDDLEEPAPMEASIGVERSKYSRGAVFRRRWSSLSTLSNSVKSASTVDTARWKSQTVKIDILSENEDNHPPIDNECSPGGSGENVRSEMFESALQRLPLKDSSSIHTRPSSSSSKSSASKAGIDTTFIGFSVDELSEKDQLRRYKEAYGAQFAELTTIISELMNNVGVSRQEWQSLGPTTTEQVNSDPGAGIPGFLRMKNSMHRLKEHFTAIREERDTVVLALRDREERFQALAEQMVSFENRAESEKQTLVMEYEGRLHTALSDAAEKSAEFDHRAIEYQVTLEDLKTQVARFQVALSDLKSQVADRDTHVTALEGTLSNEGRRLALAELRRAHLEERVAALMAELSVAESTAKDATLTIENLRIQMNSLKSSNAELEARIKDADFMEERVKLVTSDLESRRLSEVEHLHRELNATQQMLSVRNQMIEDLRFQLGRTVAGIGLSTAERPNPARWHVDINEELIEVMSAQWVYWLLPHLSQFVQQRYASEVDTLRHQLADQKALMLTREAQSITVLSKIEERATSLREENTFLTCTVENLKEFSKQIADQLKEREDDSLKRDIQLMSTRGEVLQQENRIKDLLAEIDGLRIRWEQTRTDLDSASQHIASLETSRNLLLNKIDESNRVLLAKSMEAEELGTRLTDANEREEVALNKLATSETEVLRLCSELQICNRDAVEGRETRQRLETEAARLKAKSADLEQQLLLYGEEPRSKLMFVMKEVERLQVVEKHSEELRVLCENLEKDLELMRLKVAKMTDSEFFMGSVIQHFIEAFTLTFCQQEPQSVPDDRSLQQFLEISMLEYMESTLPPVQLLRLAEIDDLIRTMGGQVFGLAHFAKETSTAEFEGQWAHLHSQMICLVDRDTLSHRIYDLLMVVASSWKQRRDEAIAKVGPALSTLGKLRSTMYRLLTTASNTTLSVQTTSESEKAALSEKNKALSELVRTLKSEGDKTLKALKRQESKIRTLEEGRLRMLNLIMELRKASVPKELRGIEVTEDIEWEPY